MSLFANLKSDGLEKSEDRLGGYQPLETDIYTGTIKAMYAGKSDGGAMSVSIIVDIGGGKEYRETLWVTNKNGENFFLNQQDKTKKVPLPGFTVADDICLITVEKPLAEMDTEQRVIKLFNYDTKKEENTSVDMLIEAIGKPVSLGIVKELRNKSVKNADGKYEDTAETRTVNAIEKVFHPEAKMTVAEAREGANTAAFWDNWSKRNKGIERDKRSIKDGQAGGDRKAPAPKAGAAGGEAAAPRKSLFGNKT